MHVAEHRVQTTQATAKHWKAREALGTALVVGSMLFGFAGIGATQRDGGPVWLCSLAILGFLIGLGVFISARFGAWWHHG